MLLSRHSYQIPTHRHTHTHTHIHGHTQLAGNCIARASAAGQSNAGKCPLCASAHVQPHTHICTHKYIYYIAYYIYYGCLRCELSVLAMIWFMNRQRKLRAHVCECVRVCLSVCVCVKHTKSAFICMRISSPFVASPLKRKTSVRCCGMIWTDKMLLVIGFIYSKYFLYKDECSSGKWTVFRFKALLWCSPD